MPIRDRIKELRRVKASELRANPRNWRLHSEAQAGALRGVLQEVGYADALIAREMPDGRLELIDGHLRAETTPDQEVPVLIVDLDDAEAAKVLATLDPLAAMAETNQKTLDKLLAEIQTEQAGLQVLLDELKGEPKPTDENIYTSKIVSPVYEPKGERPDIAELYDDSKTKELISGIDASELPEDTKAFMRLAAARHTKFHFGRIAEWYCHAKPALQRLIERSGMVIIDIRQAIEYGFVHMTERLGALLEEEIEDKNGDDNA